MNHKYNYSFVTKNESKSMDLATRLGRSLYKVAGRGPIVILLQGLLGAGKTYFVKGLGVGFGIKENIVSPTYTIENEYKFFSEAAKYDFVHIDLYRVEDGFNLDLLEFKKRMLSGAVVAIEWPERAFEYLKNISDQQKIYITLTQMGPNIRQIDIQSGYKLF